MHFSIENEHLRLKPCKRGLTLYNVNDVFIGRSLELYREAQENELGLLGQILKPGAVVIDAGANIGVHSQFFAAAVGPEGRVAAFEPQRIVHQMLCANLALNGVSNAHAFHAALAHEPGRTMVPVLDPSVEQNFGAARVAAEAQGEEVPAMRIDQLTLPGCQLIKIDVEGAELEVLRGAEGTIRAHAPFLYVENSEEARSAELAQTIMDLGYDCYWHVPLFFNQENEARRQDNVFGALVCINMLCVPQALGMNVSGLKKLATADESWREGVLHSGG
ncbi:MAG: FkbM family methyltransferase [Desulfovibrionaceae bacterium]